jgi:hypothetical protein
MSGFACVFLCLSLGFAFGQEKDDQPEVKITGSEAAKSKLLVNRGRENPFAPLVRTIPRKPIIVEDDPEEVEVVVRPTRPKELEPLSLDGVMWSPKKPMAMINGVLVAADDEIDGWLVIEIKRNEVVVEGRGEQKTLKVSAPTFDKRARRKSSKGGG